VRGLTVTFCPFAAPKPRRYTGSRAYFASWCINKRLPKKETDRRREREEEGKEGEIQRRCNVSINQRASRLAESPRSLSSQFHLADRPDRRSIHRQILTGRITARYLLPNAAAIGSRILFSQSRSTRGAYRFISALATARPIALPSHFFSFPPPPPPPPFLSPSFPLCFLHNFMLQPVAINHRAFPVYVQQFDVCILRTVDAKRARLRDAIVNDDSRDSPGRVRVRGEKGFRRYPKFIP